MRRRTSRSAGILEVDDAAVAESFRAERRPLQRACPTPPTSVPIAIPMIGGSPRRGITGTSTNAHAIVATLNIAGDRAGMKNRRSELSMPIIATDAATVVRNGSIILVSVVVNSSLPGVAANRGAIRLVIGPGKDDPEDHQAAGNDEQRVDHEVAEMPRRVAPFARERTGERGDEGSRHRAFGKEIAQQVRDSEGDVERVHFDATAGAEQCREDRLAGDTQHAAGHRGDADEPGRTGQPRTHSAAECRDCRCDEEPVEPCGRLSVPPKKRLWVG